MRFFTQIFRKNTPPPQYGLSENDDYFCLVCYENGQFHTNWYEKRTFPTLTEVIGAGKNFKNFPHTRAVKASYIWRKSLILPAHYAELKIYQQIIQHLKQDLPLPLSQIYFDYQVFPHPEKQGWQIQIYALSKTFADQLMLNHQTRLDCEWNCIQRAFHFLANQKIIPNRKTGYFVGGRLIQTHENMFSETDLNHTEELSEIYSTQILSSENHLNVIPITLDGDLICETLYLSALGASLWQNTSI